LVGALVIHRKKSPPISVRHTAASSMGEQYTCAGGGGKPSTVCRVLVTGFKGFIITCVQCVRWANADLRRSTCRPLKINQTRLLAGQKLVNWCGCTILITAPTIFFSYSRVAALLGLLKVLSQTPQIVHRNECTHTPDTRFEPRWHSRNCPRRRCNWVC
jgi:hypothetical protein